MEENKLDVLFISPGSAKHVYQCLADKYSGIGTPTWALLLAQSCRKQGYNVAILDVLAERMNHEQAINRIKELNPKLICFVVYGENCNSGTTQMSGTVLLAENIKKAGVTIPISVAGSHVQALPYEVLENEPFLDFIFTNEAVYVLWNILKEDLSDITKLEHIKGIGFRKDGKSILTDPEKIVPQSRMDEDLPGYAWDLLPYDKKPFDLYRSPLWHGEYDHEKRSPYAAIYTSLGCRFKCEFCMINILNRDDKDEIGVASNYNTMRYWSPEFIIKEFDKVIDMGVETIRISDEMFLLAPKYYKPLCEMLAERNKDDKLRMWAYSRIDTVRRPEILDLVRKAGIKWLCLGIESGDKDVRLEVSKGRFEDVDIRNVVQQVHDADIEIMANYLFGLPTDNIETMQKTYDLSEELCTVAWNAYAVMPLPGSKLYKDAVEAGYDLPEDYAGYSFHAYTTKPMPTKYCTPAEVLKFRDDAFDKYHAYPPFLERVKKRYGQVAVDNIIEQSKLKLKRKILGDKL